MNKWQSCFWKNHLIRLYSDLIKHLPLVFPRFHHSFLFSRENGDSKHIFIQQNRPADNSRRLWGVVTFPQYLAGVNSLPQFDPDLYKWRQEKTPRVSLCLYCNIRRAINAKLHWKTGLQWRHNFRQPCNFLFMLVPDKRQYVIVPGMDNRGKRGKYNSFI